MPAKNKLSLAVQYADPRLKDHVSRAQVRRWVQAALFAPAELTIRFVDEQEGRELNRSFRGKDYPTNVLTFAYTDEEGAPRPDEMDPTRADIILCTEVLEREAAEQNIPVPDHAAHLIVHGVLHAQGYDHENDEEAEEMEGLEISILSVLGVANPYQGDGDSNQKE